MKILKCVMVGDGAAGKTYAAEAYKKKCYPSYLGYVPTVYDSFRINVEYEGNDVTMFIYDSAGQEDYDRIRPLDYAGADVVLYWYNVTSPDSYDNILEKWYPEIKHFVPNALSAVVGSQIDLRNDPHTLEHLKKMKQKVVTEADGIKLATRINAETYMECSSLTLYGIDNVFQEAARIGMQNRERAGKQESDKTFGIDPRLLNMIRSSSTLFNDVLKHGMEDNYDIRVMAVGKARAGKSTLTRRLLKIPVKLKEYNSTNGIEVHIHNCQVELGTGSWVYKKRSIVSKMKKLLLKRIKKHESEANSTKNRGSRDFHQRCAIMLQNFQEAEEVYFQFRTKLKESYETKREEIEHSKVDSIGNAENSNISGNEQEKTQFDKSDNSSNNSVQSKTPIAVTSGPTSKPLHSNIDDKDIEQTLEKAKTLKPVSYQLTAKVSFYDFAGQDIFHASHPTFLSPKATYLLVFDLNEMYNSRQNVSKAALKDVQYFGDCRGAGFLRDRECLFFWLNVIYMFAALKGGFHPHVLLVGTHIDKLPKTKRYQIVEECFRELRCSLAETPLKDILSQQEFVVDNTKKNDESFAQIKAEILRLAKLQPHWGEKTPTKWLPLDRELQCLKEDGLKILSLEELKEINEGMQVKITEEKELDMFLRFLHDSGEIIFYSDAVLRNHIVLDQVWLINGLKMIITAERFALRIPKLAEKWKDFYETGVVCRSTIVDIFEECNDTALYENHEHVLLLMEKFLFIASPVDISAEDKERQDDQAEKQEKEISYIIPCMVHREIETEMITVTNDMLKTPVFAMVSLNHFLPPAVFQKVLAMCIKEWSIVEHQGQKLIFCGVCKFNIDNSKNYKMLIFLVGYAIHARIESYVDGVRPPQDVCAQIRNFLVQSLRSVLKGMGFSDKFRTCIQCPQFSPIENGGYFDLEHLDGQENVTCDDCKKSHSIHTKEMFDSWIEQKKQTLAEAKALTESLNKSSSEERTKPPEGKSLDVEPDGQPDGQSRDAEPNGHSLDGEPDGQPNGQSLGTEPNGHSLDGEPDGQPDGKSLDAEPGGHSLDAEPDGQPIGQSLDAEPDGQPDSQQLDGVLDGQSGGHSLDAEQDGQPVETLQEETPITQEHINHARICNALVTTCAEGLREILLNHAPTGYNDIYSAILANQGTLTSMRQLRQEQINLIFPDPNNRYTGTVDQFDITLLYALIRNVSSVQEPVTRWGREPDDQPRDTSIGANVERIRQFRNKITGHSVDGRLGDQTFEAYWNEIGNIMDDIESIIGDKGFREALEKRKKQAITPNEAKEMRTRFDRYQTNLQEEMLPLVEALQNLGEKVKNLQAKVDTRL